MTFLAGRITVDPEQPGGRPCVRGMRIRVGDVLDLLALGLADRGPRGVCWGGWRRVGPAPRDRGRDMHTYIVTVTAADSVGIVQSVTGTLRDVRGNIVELSQTVMRGYFTIILAVEFDSEQAPEKLASALSERGRAFDLTVAVMPGRAEGVKPPVADGERFILTVLGADHAGNIHGISGCLARMGVNIVDLHARVAGARFSLVMEAFLPPDLAPDAVRAELERFGEGLGLESFVQHENIFMATSEPTPVRVGPAAHPGGVAVVPH